MGILTSPADRRATPRRSLDQIPRITGVKISSADVDVINASRCGILVAGTVRLNPGTQIPVEIFCADAPVRLRGRVVRSQVTELSAKGLRYQIAIAFNRPLALLDEEDSWVFEIDDVELGDPDPALAGNRW